MNGLSSLEYDNSFARQLPADSVATNSRRQVLNAAYSHVDPTPVSNPKVIAFSREMATRLGLSEDYLRGLEAAQILSGNEVATGMKPYAACYGGHQFGNWAGQLGDGRAISLGEVVNAEQERWELQLKGAGATPYSRMGDGRAVMRSSVREFLCSEAMHHLGVPTTRALSLVATGDLVVRDMFYDGHPRPEPGAIVCRVAPTFVRFGNFEILASRNDKELLRRLLRYVVDFHLPELLSNVPSDPSDEQLAGALFKHVAERTAEMVDHWMRVGFVHGVMNTDNMSILGLTIDYGPYGWLEGFEPDWTPNTTDAHGRRYCYGNQPEIALWNVVRLANALAPIVEDVSLLQEGVEAFRATFEVCHRDSMLAKLGLAEHRKGDDELIRDLMGALQLTETDMTIFFRNLADVPVDEGVRPEERLRPLLDAYYRPDQLVDGIRGEVQSWLETYARRARLDGRPQPERAQQMNRANPKYVLRNYMAQLAIDKAEEGDGSVVMELLELLRRPYDEQPEMAHYAVKRPEWARHRPGCSMLSCSS
ncbi:MAG: YdiU family protein [Myxococcales bacterium]|nr:YdiU family protein [Myxococcales bacterium]